VMQPLASATDRISAPAERVDFIQGAPFRAHSSHG
jgi:hypothetical protein